MLCENHLFEIGSPRNLQDLSATWQGRALSRRALLRSFGLGGALALAGCEIPPEVIVPVLTATVAEIIKAALNYTFHGGETISQPTQFPVPGVQFRNVNAKPDGFEGDTAETFCCPVSILKRRDRERYVQIPAQGGLWSLMRGRDNKNIFRIHYNWLIWIADEDTCNRTVNGNSRFEPCGINGCQTQVNRQAFLSADNKDELFFFDVKDITHEHARNHHRPVTQCPVIQGNPEPFNCPLA